MFQDARIKLTLWYLLIIMLVSGFFSLIVYRGFTKELGRGFRYQAMHTLPERRLYIQGQGVYTRILPFMIYPDDLPPEEYLEFIELAKRRFALQLLIINGGILFLAGTAGYFLAGKTLQPIETMVDGQKRFVADASHELRTPLTSMKAEVEVALKDRRLKTKDLKVILRSNLDEVDKMKYFTDYLLTLSKYEANGKDLPMEKVDLTEAVRQAIERNQAQAKNKDIKLITNLTDQMVKGNPQSLVELFSILINNAIKYSKTSSSISISTRKNKKHAVIEIKDNGVGIAEKDLPHIFDRFYRADSARNKNDIDGFGLGLSIAKSIVDLHKGEIKVKSRPGKSTTFTVILPR